MIGRAGRSHDERGVVHILVNSEDEGVLDEIFEEGGTTVVSAMRSPDLLASMILPEICRGDVTSLESARKWASRSFCNSPPVRVALELLRTVEAVRLNGEVYQSTDLGDCASKFYLHPADVYAWKENFSKLFELGLDDDNIAPAWALGNVPFDRIVGDLGEKRYIAKECENRVPLGLDIIKGSLINITTWWYLMGGPSVGPLRPACLERRRDYNRISCALHWLNSSIGWDRTSFFEDLELRVRKGIDSSLVPLCRCEGIGKGRAEYLYEIGVRGPDDMHKALSQVGDDVDEEFRKAIENVVWRFGKEGD
jgi:replicative superfamily II helicase